MNEKEGLKYDALHSRIRRKYGNAPLCTLCDNRNNYRLEWALIKGREYTFNINDYIPLCASCHRKYDGNVGKVGMRKTYIPSLNRKPIHNSKGDKYLSVTGASDATGISRTAITNNLSGLSKTAGGLLWKRS